MPAQNSADPANEIAGGKVDAAFHDRVSSAIRPAQPVPPDPCGSPACIALIWSECEKRFVGSPTDAAWYCARVVGFTSNPVFATAASRPCAHSGCSAASPLFNPYGVPSCAVTGSSVVLVSGSASEPRAAWYAACADPESGTSMLCPSLPPSRKTHTSAL